METKERIELLEKAGDALTEAMNAIEEAVAGTNHEANVKAYTLAHLRNWRDGDNPYDPSLPVITGWLLEDVGLTMEEFEGAFTI